MYTQGSYNKPGLAMDILLVTILDPVGLTCVHNQKFDHSERNAVHS